MHAHDDWDEPRRRVWFSLEEVLHLTASVVVLTLAFAMVLERSETGSFGLTFDLPKLLSLLPYSAIAVVPAFILHELAHKIAAQRKDMWAEFRANFLGLTAGLGVTAFTGLLFAIPGAVHIFGHASKRDSGIISIVGPMVNLVLGYGALLLDPVLPPIRIGSFGSFLELITLLNLVLAAFNMLPFGPLDGRKVMRWSWLGFAGMWALIVALGFLYFS